jgi:hypothetical protein
MRIPSAKVCTHTHSLLRETDRRVCVLVLSGWCWCGVGCCICALENYTCKRALSKQYARSSLFVRLARLILRTESESQQSRVSRRSHCPCMLRASENTAANTHIIIIIIRRNFNNQSLPLLTTATAASLLVNYYKKAQHPQIETMRRAHKTNRPEPEIAKSSTDARRTRRARTKTHAEHFRLLG